MAGSGIPFDRVADRYDDSRGGLARGRAHAEAMLPWVPRTGPVVEVGVGTGAVAAGLAEHGLPVLGVDLSLPMLAQAHERLPGRVLGGDALRLPLRDAAASAAYFVHVLHLVGDVTAALAEAARVVAPGGRVLAVCAPQRPERSDVLEIVEALRARLGRTGRTDNPDEVVDRAASVGLQVEHRSEFTRLETYSLADVARGVEQRLWSWAWDVDDAEWQRQSAAAVAELRALPDQDRRREQPDARTLLVFAR